jgi:hypothetical protein
MTYVNFIRNLSHQINQDRNKLFSVLFPSHDKTHLRTIIALAERSHSDEDQSA